MRTRFTDKVRCKACSKPTVIGQLDVPKGGEPLEPFSCYCPCDSAKTRPLVSFTGQCLQVNEDFAELVGAVESVCQTSS